MLKQDPMTCMFPHGIEMSERRGQAAVATLDVLPAEMHGDRSALEAAGVKILGPVPDDPLFVRAEIPPGWARRPTDHAYYTEIFDARGRKRATVFYKAAHYDRRADVYVERRYRCSAYDRAHNQPQVGMVYDADGTIVYETAPVQCRAWRDVYEARVRLEEECEGWLDKHKPNWRDPAAYWDEP